jgi:hypothetical protein
MFLVMALTTKMSDLLGRLQTLSTQIDRCRNVMRRYMVILVACAETKLYQLPEAAAAFEDPETQAALKLLRRIRNGGKCQPFVRVSSDVLTECVIKPFAALAKVRDPNGMHAFPALKILFHRFDDLRIATFLDYVTRLAVEDAAFAILDEWFLTRIRYLTQASCKNAIPMPQVAQKPDKCREALLQPMREIRRALRITKRLVSQRSVAQSAQRI